MRPQPVCATPRMAWWYQHEKRARAMRGGSHVHALLGVATERRRRRSTSRDQCAGAHMPSPQQLKAAWGGQQ